MTGTGLAPQRKLKDRLLLALAERAGAWYLRALETRVDRDSYFPEYLEAARAEGRGVILAFWHAQMIPLAVHYRQQGIVVLISPHRDGEIIARLVEARGFRTARGSSNRDSAKVAATVLKLLKQERATVAFTPDGPRGPRERVQGGIIRVAAMTGAPIVTMAAVAAPCRRLKSWDRFRVPFPWSKFHVRLGQPFTVPRGVTPEQEEEYRLRLEQALNDLTAEAEKSLPGEPWKNRAGALLLRLAATVWRMLPAAAALRSGEWLGRLVCRLDRRHRVLAEENLRRALPAVGAADARAMIRRNFAHYGRSLVEFVRLKKYVNSGAAIKVPFTVEQHIHDAVRAGKGYIILTGHLGNFELLGAVITARGHRFVTLARVAGAPALERVLQEVRASVGMRMIDKDEAGRNILAALRRNEGVAILIDVNAGHKGIFVPLFGRPASTYAIVAELAKRTGCAVLPMFVHREADGTHVVDIEGPLPWLPATADQDDIAANTAQYNRVYEKFIARYPDQWFWAHNRWKTRPDAGG
ncbi:MAG TPA: DUF374 domain-containing protein [bacterium]|nr:DUF374 domain-containing protein [bacterium]